MSSGLASALAPRTPWRAFAWYVGLTVLMTWPLATVLATTLPKDFGDPLLNIWIIGWNATHFLRLLKGDVSAAGELWHGNIFYPARYTLGYSELLIAQSVQALPVYAVTGNLVLGYNLLFLSTFALSGLGMFLLARALTSDWRAAFLAGLVFAFLPYRSYQAPHLQVMSSQWMPFALYGFHRFAASGRWRPLAGGALALVAQNLSCGYFLVYFSLFVPLFVLHELGRHGRLGDRRAWLQLAAAAVLVAGLTLPFMQPYLALRDLHGTLRYLDEITAFSADTWSWVTAEADLTVWGRWLRALDRPEAALFPGVLPLVLACVALIGGARRAWRATAHPGPPSQTVTVRTPVLHALMRVPVWVGGALVVAGLASAVLLVAGGGGLHKVLGVRIRIESLTRALWLMTLGITVLLAASARARQVARHIVRSPLACALVCAVVAMYLSLGPDPRANRGELSGPRLFLWLYETLPGLSGLRVPARFAMVAYLFLALASAWGARDLLTRARSGILALVLAVVWLLEAAVLPFPLGAAMGAETAGIVPPPPSVTAGRNLPPIYAQVRDLPKGTILLELPIGDIAWELRHVYYATTHWHPIVNGYSGYTPRPYAEMAGALRNPYRDPEAAWQRVLAAGVTHIVVHRDAYEGDLPPAPYRWLDEKGAQLLSTQGPLSLYRVPRE